LGRLQRHPEIRSTHKAQDEARLTNLLTFEEYIPGGQSARSVVPSPESAMQRPNEVRQRAT
jgi:hypothetical protein